MRFSCAPIVAFLAAACAAGPAVTDGFSDFWSGFQTAVADDDVDAVRRLSRFPFLFEGEQVDGAGFPAVYAALFTGQARDCLAAAAPVPEEDRYVAFCGAIMYYFERGDDGWRFVEFGADPEALDNDGFGGNAGTSPELGSWRFADGRAAPWAPGSAAHLAGSALIGTRVAALSDHVLGTDPLGCDNAVYEFVVMPAEGLFQGGLPAPATAAARGLGMDRVPALTMSVRCDTGIFDYHHMAGDTLLLGFDNIVWKLAPEAAGATPASAVRALLADHMTGAMHFTPDAFARKRHYVSATLAAAAAEYFARPQPADEVPPINGDPFTDSQEHPDRFTFGAIQTDGDRATVRVVFSDGIRSRPVDFLLVRQGARWLLDDLRYEDGTTLRELLRQ